MLLFNQGSFYLFNKISTYHDKSNWLKISPASGRYIPVLLFTLVNILPISYN